MSNQAVGNVYQSIIEDVINSSRVDFEESGVDDSVLEELRKGWQQKLSQLDVARFPWDPKPEAPPPAQSEPSASTSSAQNHHSQAQFPHELSLPNAAPFQNGIKQEPGFVNQDSVKQEPASQSGPMPPFPGYNGTDSKDSIAASRAAQQLQLQYGMRAAGSINAIQDRMEQQQQQQAVGQQNPGDQGAAPMPQQQAAQAADVANHFSNDQTDGAGDDKNHSEGVLFQRGATGRARELGRVDIDRMLREQIAAKAKAMEGGGLMLPLGKANRRRTAPARRGKGKGVGAFDGGDDEDDIDDEDAINSDLDDSGEDREDDEVDDEGLGHIMLCMYDKVQRVKNKWKCTLKDGVLTVNGKEYVFHKATGEYEW